MTIIWIKDSGLSSGPWARWRTSQAQGCSPQPCMAPSCGADCSLGCPCCPPAAAGTTGCRSCGWFWGGKSPAPSWWWKRTGWSSRGESWVGQGMFLLHTVPVQQRPRCPNHLGSALETGYPPTWTAGCGTGSVSTWGKDTILPSSSPPVQPVYDVDKIV